MPSLRLNAFEPLCPASQANPVSSVTLRGLPATTRSSTLPSPFVSPAFKTRPLVGTLLPRSSAFTRVSHWSKSPRAARLRASARAVTAATSFDSTSHRDRSSGRGTKTAGGVLLTFPSIARWVVLLKNADIE